MSECFPPVTSLEWRFLLVDLGVSECFLPFSIVRGGKRSLTRILVSVFCQSLRVVGLFTGYLL